MNLKAPDTRAILLEGLRQGLQGRVVQLYTNLSLAGETETEERAKRGLARAIEAYERAWKYVHKIT